jgi:hypothetical protein
MRQRVPFSVFSKPAVEEIRSDVALLTGIAKMMHAHDNERTVASTSVAVAGCLHDKHEYEKT